ncbi:MAG: cobalamin biosynthesis protein CbiD [Acidaminobacter sp.]|uniref:cobalt-precorrin-5B (C(1))-methyltransferase CbiD n=1 Tax=Acidaminobacter sp. TaxID=1872102 RepID=UPI00137C69B8|nr:cobalt-precorrin-5B (C(1))-methyltransferase CbiD [Acidaminobacter sp.]MZQ98898.1 cobalamin biosynthesis protein CbiD [Acidaminobacter sp.]
MTSDFGVVVKHGKALRYGYTTGTCATAAAAAAAEMLLSGKRVDKVRVTLPAGGEIELETAHPEMMPDFARCGIIKDAGDDPDVTHGIEIMAEVRFQPESATGITVSGGSGVGVVTARGLPCEVGGPAINPVPMKMICQHVGAVATRYGIEDDRGLSVQISAVNGEEIAKKTFNARLGIHGGISILGTTGIVEPMSEQALIDTIKVLIDKASQQHPEVALISPGNYGRDYCREVLKLDLETGVKCSNYIGETLDYLVYKGFKEILLVGHVGKLVKLAAGIMQTHSSMADGRMEILGVHSAMAGAPSALVGKIMACGTTDEAVEVLDEAELTKAVFDSIMERICFQLNYRTRGAMKVEVILFSTQDAVIGETDGALALARRLREMRYVE